MIKDMIITNRTNKDSGNSEIELTIIDAGGGKNKKATISVEKEISKEVVERFTLVAKSCHNRYIDSLIEELITKAERQNA